MTRPLRHLLILLLLMTTVIIEGHRDTDRKLSPWLRHLVTSEEQALRRAAYSGEGKTAAVDDRKVCAFVRIQGDGDEVLGRYHCRSLAQAGTIHIANIPIRELTRMTADAQVTAIEASPSGQVLLDSMSTHLNTLPIYTGTKLPQAYTGKNVVVGIMDIGFDLTHPNFYSRDLSEYRIKALWDMLSTDTVGSAFPVGRDYVGQEALLALQHSRDGKDLTHGTYTLGVAAGSGYDSPYRGMAPESDICIVANAVTNNKEYIAPADYYKYTFATDALGFKYIFDYAKSVGKPCVISLSEGSVQDFWGYDQLYYEMLDSLVGPGHILVAAAGNQGGKKSWMHKERGIISKGTFLSSWQVHQSTAKSADDFLLRMVFYDKEVNDTLLIASREVLESQDSVYRLQDLPVDSLIIEAYPSCYNPEETCYDITFYSKGTIGIDTPLSLEIIGIDADVELWRSSGDFTNHEKNPLLNDTEISHNIHSPSSAPCVISVGATTYRDSVMNSEGEWRVFVNGRYGRIADMSSTGPTMDGRIKPDVMAPGINIISSYNSFYIAAHPDADDAKWNVAYYDYDGRTYAWNCNSGTSSSSPAVAGAIALWLQAKPDLTPEEAMDIIAHTSHHNDPTLSYPNNQYGYGELDAYRGLLYLLGIDGIEEISHHATPVHMTFSNDGQLRLLFPEALPASLLVSVYNLSGTVVSRQQVAAGATESLLAIPHTQPGTVLAVQLNGVPSLSGSMLVRR